MSNTKDSSLSDWTIFKWINASTQVSSWLTYGILINGHTNLKSFNPRIQLVVPVKTYITT